MSDSTGVPAAPPAVAPAPAQASTPEVQPPTVPSAAFTQEQLNSAIAEEKRKWKQQQDAAIAEAGRKAAEAEAKQKGEFEKLATDRGARLETIEADYATLQERYTALTELIEKQAKGRIQALPDELRAMKPEGDVTALLDWLGKAEIAASKLLSTPRSPGTPAGPRLGSGIGSYDSPAEILAQKRASGGYDL